jgi:phage shock protein PspC (stress-responsive transcriptional regulator)
MARGPPPRDLEAMSQTTPPPSDPDEPRRDDPTSPVGDLEGAADVPGADDTRADEAPTAQAPTGGPEAPTVAGGSGGAGSGGAEIPRGGGGTAPPPRPRRFLRSRDDRVIGGVCSGLARYFGIDPLLVRIATVALVFVGGAAIIAYLAALVFVPEDDGSGNPSAERPSRTTTIVGASAIILVGIILASDGWWHTGWLFGALIPLSIVLAVLAVAGRQLLRDRGEHRPSAGRIVGAALMVGAGLVGLAAAFVAAAWATAAGGGVAIAAIIVALGAAMIALAFGGNARRARWLAIPALVLAVPAGVVAAADVDVDGGVGDRTYRPASAFDLKPKYQLGIGELRLDLRRMEWPQERIVDVNIDVGVGHGLILVPPGVCVQAANHTGIGYNNVLGDDAGGIDVDYDAGTLARATGPRLMLHGDLGIGAIEVLHDDPRGDFGDRDFGNGAPGSISHDLAAQGCAGSPA